MHHDSFCCERPEFNNSIPFPTRRMGLEYISKTYSNVGFLPETCPEKCRPKDHPEWTRCWNWYTWKSFLVDPIKFIFNPFFNLSFNMENKPLPVGVLFNNCVNGLGNFIVHKFRFCCFVFQQNWQAHLHLYCTVTDQMFWTFFQSSFLKWVTKYK